MKPMAFFTGQFQTGENGTRELLLRHEAAYIPHRSAQRVAASQQEPENQFLDEICTGRFEEVFDEAAHRFALVGILQMICGFV